MTDIMGIIYLAIAFAAGMLVGSNNPTWLSSKWKDVQKKAEQVKDEEFFDKLADKLKERMK